MKKSVKVQPHLNAIWDCNKKMLESTVQGRHQSKQYQPWCHR